MGLLTVIPWNCKRHLQKLYSGEGGQSTRFSNLSATWLAACLIIFFGISHFFLWKSLVELCYSLSKMPTSPNASVSGLFWRQACLCESQSGYLCTCCQLFHQWARHTASCDTATTHAWSHAQRRHGSATSWQRFNRSAQTEPHVVSLWGS